MAQNPPVDIGVERRPLRAVADDEQPASSASWARRRANASISTGRPCQGFRLPTKPTVKTPGGAGRLGRTRGEALGIDPVGDTSCTRPRAAGWRSRQLASSSDTAINAEPPRSNAPARSADRGPRAPVLRLLLDERSIDLQEAGDPASRAYSIPAKLHSAWRSYDNVEAPLRRSAAVTWVGGDALGRRNSTAAGNAGSGWVPPRGRRPAALEAGREELQLDAATQQGAQHLLHVDRASLAAEDGTPGSAQT